MVISSLSLVVKKAPLRADDDSGHKTSELKSEKEMDFFTHPPIKYHNIYIFIDIYKLIISK